MITNKCYRPKYVKFDPKKTLDLTVNMFTEQAARQGVLLELKESGYIPSPVERGQRTRAQISELFEVVDSQEGLTTELPCLEGDEARFL